MKEIGIRVINSYCSSESWWPIDGGCVKGRDRIESNKLTHY